MKAFDSILASISVVWISHHHADHICGFLNLIENIQKMHWRRRSSGKSNESGSGSGSDDSESARSDNVSHSQPILVISPPAVQQYFEYGVNISGLDHLVEFLPTSATLYAGCTTRVAQQTQGSLIQLRSVAVQHCRDSYGVVLDFKNGMKVVYSGDCRPSASLIAAGAGCDLLIHEATFGDERCDDAVKKRHCTASEALSVAARMRVGSNIKKHEKGARGGGYSGHMAAGSSQLREITNDSPDGQSVGLTILTHFSQRYPPYYQHSSTDAAVSSATQNMHTAATEPPSAQTPSHVSVPFIGLPATQNYPDSRPPPPQLPFPRAPGPPPLGVPSQLPYTPSPRPYTHLPLLFSGFPRPPPPIPSLVWQPHAQSQFPCPPQMPTGRPRMQPPPLQPTYNAIGASFSSTTAPEGQTLTGSRQWAPYNPPPMFAVAFDFLQVSVPSQSQWLPSATKAMHTLLQALDESESQQKAGSGYKLAL